MDAEPAQPVPALLPRLPLPYERIVAFLAGPLATVIGVIATAVVHSNISHSAALAVATFVLSAGATLAGHIAWLRNVPKWWAHIADVGQPMAVLPLGDRAEDNMIEADINASDPLNATAEDYSREDGNELAHRSRNA